MLSLRIRALMAASLLAACGTSPKTGVDAGAIPDAGPVDAGMPFIGSDGGSPDGGCPFLYCEDFEHYSGSVANGAVLGPWIASVSGIGVTATIDPSNGFGGTQGLRITAPPDAGALRATLNQKNPVGLVEGNDLFGRAEIYYSEASDAGLPLAVHSWIFNASGTDPDAGPVSMNMGGGGAKMQLNYHAPAPIPEASVQGGVMTTGAWHCIQWEYDGAGMPTDDTANVWIDGVLAMNVPESKGWAWPVPWTSMDFGFTHYQVLPNAVDLVVDHFAVDDKMVPCP